MSKEKPWPEHLEEVPRENWNIARAGMVAGELAQHPDKRNPRGIYESGERLWTTPFSRFHRLKCKLFGHNTETLPLLSMDAEPIGEVEWCRTCTSVIQRRDEDG